MVVRSLKALIVMKNTMMSGLLCCFGGKLFVMVEVAKHVVSDVLLI